MILMVFCVFLVGFIDFGGVSIVFSMVCLPRFLRDFSRFELVWRFLSFKNAKSRWLFRFASKVVLDSDGEEPKPNEIPVSWEFANFWWFLMFF